MCYKNFLFAVSTLSWSDLKYLCTFKALYLFSSYYSICLTPLLSLIFHYFIHFFKLVYGWSDLVTSINLRFRLACCYAEHWKAKVFVLHVWVHAAHKLNMQSKQRFDGFTVVFFGTSRWVWFEQQQELGLHKCDHMSVIWLEFECKASLGGGVCTLTFSLKLWSGATGRREERGTRGPQTGRERGGWLRAVMWLSAALCFLSHRACVRHLCSGSPFLSSYHYHSFDYCCRFITSEGTVRQEGTFSFFADADKRLQRRTVTHEQPCRRVVLGTRFRVSKWCWTGLKTVIYVSCTEIK